MARMKVPSKVPSIDSIYNQARRARRARGNAEPPYRVYVLDNLPPHHGASLDGGGGSGVSVEAITIVIIISMTNYNHHPHT